MKTEFTLSSQVHSLNLCRTWGKWCWKEGLLIIFTKTVIYYYCLLCYQIYSDTGFFWQQYKDRASSKRFTIWRMIFKNADALVAGVQKQLWESKSDHLLSVVCWTTKTASFCFLLTTQVLPTASKICHKDAFTGSFCFIRICSLISISVGFYGTYKVMSKLNIVVFPGIRNDATDAKNEVFSIC